MPRNYIVHHLENQKIDLQMIQRPLLFTLLLLTTLHNLSFAANADTVVTYSNAMKKEIKAVIITPDDYKSGKEFPVVYLLHGYSGDYANWITKSPSIKNASDLYHMIIVCPDGGYGSWYWDSPVDKNYQYETYISKELTGWVDKNYKTLKSSAGRAITGLSMGGHGALYLAFRHQDIFGAAGSMSGGVDIRPFPGHWDMAARLGKYADQPENWEQNTVINLLYLLTPKSLKLIIDCGTEDFFYKVNENLHEQLIQRNIPHDYISRPGAHNWDYWSGAVEHQLLFIHHFFNDKQIK